MPNIKPLNDRVLLERIEVSETTAGGILLPDSAKEKPTEGRIIATGDGRRSDKGDRVPLTVKVGDRVLFSSYAGTAVKEGGSEYLILDESEILAVVDNKPFPKAKKAGGKKKTAKKGRK
jgi:chaperonin GroES